MSGKSTVGKRLVAALLSFLLLVGLIPLSVAAEITGADSAPRGLSSTPDEAPDKPGDSGEETPESVKQYPSVTLNEKAVSYQKDKTSVMYISDKDFTEYDVEVKPDNESYQKMYTDIADQNKANFSVRITNGEDTEDVAQQCDYRADSGIVTAMVHIGNIYPDGMKAGNYTITVAYTVEETETELFKADFCVVDKSPAVSNIKYNGKEHSEWAKDSATLTFEASSPILKSVSVNNITVEPGSEGYSYTVTESGFYTIKTLDLLGISTEVKTEEIKIDKTAPSSKNLKIVVAGDETVDTKKWHKNNRLVSMTLADQDSGINADSITVKGGNGQAAENLEYSYDETAHVLSFEVAEHDGYVVTFKDNVGFEGHRTLGKDNFRIDRDAPSAKDFTLSFASNVRAKDKVLNLLSFGLYSNNDIAVNVQADAAGGSKITEVSLYNGDEQLPKIDGVYVLPAPENGSADFDLYVSAVDEAGNSSGKIRVADSDVQASVNNEAIRPLKDYFPGLYEIVISKIAPAFDSEGATYSGFTKTIEVEDADSKKITNAAGKGTVSLKVEEAVTGLKSVSAAIKRENDDPVNFYHKDFTAVGEKVISDTVAYDTAALESGKYTLVYTAESNSGNTAEATEDFVIDNEAPAVKDNTFVLSETGWTNKSVNVAFTVTDKTDDAPIVNCYLGEEEIDVKSTKPGEYFFTAEKYGEYRVETADSLGNSKTDYKTPLVKIDAAAPVVKDNKWTVSNETDGQQKWTASPVNVDFDITDMPAEANAGIDTADCVKVYVKDGDSVKEDASVTKKVTKNGKCRLTFSQYGDYSFAVYDKLGNTSDKYEIGKILIDKDKPEITKVTFRTATEEEGKSVKSKAYGTYGNTALTMFVTVKNTSQFDECSPLDAAGAVEAAYVAPAAGGAITANGRVGDTDTYSFTIALSDSLKAEDMKNLSLSVTDTVGNKNSYVLGRDCTVILETEGMDKGAYEVIASLSKPIVSEIALSETPVNDCYHGEKVTVTSNVTDDVIGLDSVKVQFGHCAVTDDPSKAKLEDVTAAAGGNIETENSKITSAGISYEANIAESGLYIFRITAVNSAGNFAGEKGYVEKTFLVDNAPPQVTGFELYGNVKTSGNNGVYLSGDAPAYIRVIIKDNDAVPSAGIASVTLGDLTGGGVKHDDVNDYDYVDFTLEPGVQYKDLKAVVTDNYNQTAEKALAGAPLGGNVAVTPDDKNFEIFVNPSEGDSSAKATADWTYDFDYPAEQSADTRIFKSVDKGTVTIVLTNEKTGIQNVAVSINESAQDITPSYEKDAFGKQTKATIVIDAKAYISGEYAVDVTVKDYCNVESSFNDTFCIDKTAPEITSVNFKTSQPSPGSQFLSFITFGLYSPDDILVEVTVKDQYPSAGVTTDGIGLTGVAEGVSKGDFTEVTKAGEKDRVFVQTYTFGSDSEKPQYFNNFKVEAADIYGNTKAAGEPAKDIISVKDTKFSFDDNYDVAVAAKAPEFVGDITVNGTQPHQAADNKLWFGVNPVFNFTVKDEVTYLHAVNVTLNGEDITTSCTDESTAALPAVYTDFNTHTGDKVSDVSAVIDTNKDSISSKLKEHGKENVLSVTATANNGVTCEAKTYTFYTDINAPVQNGKFLYNNKETQTSWTNQDVTVSFNLKDTPDTFSDINPDTLTVVSDKYMESAVKNVSLEKAEDGSWNGSFVAEQYGTYTITVEDNVGNKNHFQTAAVQIDKQSPVITNVDFEQAVNNRNYGTYGNNTIKMIVTVLDPSGESQHAPLSNQPVKASYGADGSAGGNISFVGKTEDTDKLAYVFDINTENLSSKVAKLHLSVEDTGGSKRSYVLGESDTIAINSKNLSGKAYEVIASLQKASVNDFDYQNRKQSGKFINNVFNGTSETIKTTVTDEIIGLDTVKVEFGKLDAYKANVDIDTVKLDDVTGEACTEFNPNSSKITKVDVSYTGDTKESGRYVMRVTAVNNAGNTIVHSESFLVDNTAPAITAVRINGNAQTIGEKGVYLNTQNDSATITVSVTDYSDNVPTAGLKTVVVKSGTDVVQTISTEVPEQDVTFTLGDDNVYRNLNFEVTDQFNQKDNKSIQAFEVSVNGTESVKPADNFEVVTANNDSHFGNSFTYSHQPQAAIGEHKVVRYLRDDGYIYADLTNTHAGIKTAVAQIKQGDTELGININEPDRSDDSDDYKVTGKRLKFNGDNVPTGTYTVYVSVTDNCGITKEYTDTFYVDNTAPKITKIAFEKAEKSAVDTFLNLISFGMYSNDDIIVTVTAEDAGPTAGMKDGGITAGCTPTKDIDKEGKLKSDNGYQGSTDTQTYTQTFRLPVDKGRYTNLSFTATDKLGNSSENDADTEITVKDEKVTDIVNNNVSFEEIVPSTKTPVIYGLNATGKKGTNSYEADGKLWFSDNPVVSFTVSESVTKLHSVTVTLNGTDVTTSCLYNQKPLPKEFTNYQDHSGDKVPSADITLDTSAFTLFENNSNQPNVIVVNAESNNGLTAKEQSISFYVDKEKPVITKFVFSGSGNDEHKKTVYKASDLRTDYGYYFQNTTEVTVTADDNFGVGVQQIGLRAVNKDGTFRELNDYSLKNVQDNKASWIIPAEFKGELYAYAYDFVKNNANHEEEYTPENVIVETQAQHNACTHINFSKPAAVYTDSTGEYYRDDVPVTVDVDSTYAGIRQVEVEVTSPVDAKSYASYNCSVDNSGALSNSTWRTVKTDANLVTAMQGVVTVTNNSNDIKLKIRVTDRAGLFTERDITFSIDKTDPKIEISYNPAINTGNNVRGTYYHNHNVTATITVTERNFKDEDLRLNIQNTDNVIPSRGSSRLIADAGNPDNNKHVFEVVFNADGDYKVDASCSDYVKRESNKWGTDEFTVDKTIPVIESVQLTGDNSPQGRYFNEKMLATIVIHEHNFYDAEPYVVIDKEAFAPDGSAGTFPVVSNWTSLGGDRYQATIAFDNDGRYSFQVFCKDMANNEVERKAVEETFYVDTKIDETNLIFGVQPQRAYDNEVIPDIRFFDNNFDRENSKFTLARYVFGSAEPVAVTDLRFTEITDDPEFSLRVLYDNFAKLTKNDGVYVLTATIVDKAGNTETQSVTFSVNRFGPTFKLVGPETNNLIANVYTNDAPDVVIAEINVNPIGKTASNPAGKTEIQMTKDISASTLVEGTNYTAAPQETEAGKWYQVNYTIKKDNFADDGQYTLTVSSTDEFNTDVTNNTAYKDENEDRTCKASFVVDKTEPIVTIAGIQNNAYYAEASKEIVITCEDRNITSENLKIEFDGKEILPNEYKLEESSGLLRINLQLEADGNTSDRSFKVSVSDMAGNRNSDGEVSPFRLSASWIARLLHYHLPLVIIIGTALLLLIGFGVFMATKKRKKDKD